MQVTAQSTVNVESTLSTGCWDPHDTNRFSTAGGRDVQVRCDTCQLPNMLGSGSEEARILSRSKRTSIWLCMAVRQPER